MDEYFKTRIKELRSLYNKTGRLEYKHKHEELKRAQEFWVVNQITSQQDTGQSKGRRYDPFSPYQ